MPRRGRAWKGDGIQDGHAYCFWNSGTIGKGSECSRSRVVLSLFWLHVVRAPNSRLAAYCSRPA